MQKRTVLVIDDSPVSRKMLRSCFPKDREFAFLDAGDGQAGLDLHRQRRPDITFLDLTMEGMSGLACLEQIRASDPKALVIVCTADVQAKSIEKALALGAMEVVGKPPTREKVAAAVERAERRLGGAHGS